MSEELFPLDSICMDSPRLAWMKKHGAKVRRRKQGDPWEDYWDAWLERHEKAPGEPAQGLSTRGFDETDALRELGIKYGLRLWNEEGLR